MKLFYTLGLCIFATVSAMGAYPSMAFNLNDGSQKLIASDNLHIEFSEDYLKASSGSEKIQLSLADLVSMEFSAIPTAAGTQTIKGTSEIYVFSPSGIYNGKYADLNSACSSLDAGVYVIKNADGSSFKILVEK